MDEFPINEKVALQLAGLHAQVLWGPHDKGMMSRFDELEIYIHPRILSTNKTKTREDWKKSISEAHEVKEKRERERERKGRRGKGEGALTNNPFVPLSFFSSLVLERQNCRLKFGI